MDLHHLSLGGAEAVVTRRGAELQALRFHGIDLLWDAAPLWPRHAPLLFPVVGGLRGDALRHTGTAYTMPKHGFARDRDFSWLEREPASCALELQDDETTRMQYPFPFRLKVCYTLELSALRLDLDLANPGERPLPASLGLHPAFRWPLAPGTAKADHRLVFAQDEPGPLRRLDAHGLLAPGDQPTPIGGRVLPLNEGLFQEDALIFLQPRSRSLRYEAPGSPSLHIAWEGFPHLGIWAKPDLGPAFLCIEPWHGHADPAGWEGDVTAKPGSFLLAPGATRRWSLTLTADNR